MSKRLSNMGWTILAALLCLSLIVLPACQSEAEYHLTMVSAGGGSTNPAVGVHTYSPGETVNIAATADQGYSFDKWTGDVDTITDVNDPTTTITMDGDYFVEANFQQIIVPTSILVGPHGYPDDPSLTPQYGGTLLILHDSFPSNLGAAWDRGLGWNRPQNRFCCERLLGLAPDGSLVPQLATAWEQDPDAKTITLTLREGVKFHDGSDFNAEAVKWNMDKYIAGPNPELNNITNVEVTGPYEVKLTCAVWDPYLIRSFMSTGAAQIVSMESAMANGDEWCKLNPIGTGPFKWVGYETDVYIEYEAFDGYWQEGLPYLDGVRIEYVPEEAVRLASFLDDDCQIMHELSTFNARNLVDQGYWAGGRVVHMKGVAADMTKPPFDDIRVRQAMAHAFPTAAVVDAVYDGMYRSTNQLSISGWTAYNYDMVGYPYNINTAKSLLADAGYSASNPLQATLYYTDGAEEFYTVWADYMAAVNININLEPKGRRDFGPIVENPWTGLVEYQFSYNGFELTYDQSLSMTLCEDMPEYVSIVLPAEYNDLYEAMLLEEDPEAREEMYVQLNTMAIDEYCLVLPMYGFEPLCAMQPYVHDCGWGTIASEFLPEIIWLGE